MSAMRQEYGDAFGQVSPYGGSPPKAVSEGGARWPTPEAPTCPNTERPGWLLDKWHCGQDHDLERKYGIRCEDYWQLHELQSGRCALCGGQPKGWRLVVHHDHQTGEVVCLLHFTCNRLIDPVLWLLPRLLQLLADPPGRRLGLRVPKSKMTKLERRGRKERAPRTPTKPSSNGSYRDKVRAAQQAIERK